MLCLPQLLDNFDEELSKLTDKYGAFWAFSNTQFSEKSVKGVQYVNMGAGLVCPKDNAKALNKGIETLSEQAIKIDLEQNGVEAIIKRELDNHECYWSGDIEDCVHALAGYGITIEQIADVFHGRSLKH